MANHPITTIVGMYYIEDDAKDHGAYRTRQIVGQFDGGLSSPSRFSWRCAPTLAGGGFRRRSHFRPLLSQKSGRRRTLRVAPGKLEPPPKEKETAASVPKKLAQRPRYERQAMFEGNPFSGLFNW